MRVRGPAMLERGRGRSGIIVETAGNRREQGDGDGDGDGECEGQLSGVQREVERQLSSLLVLPWLLRGCHTQQKSVVVASERRAEWVEDVSKRRSAAVVEMGWLGGRRWASDRLHGVFPPPKERPKERLAFVESACQRFALAGARPHMHPAYPSPSPWIPVQSTAPVKSYRPASFDPPYCLLLPTTNSSRCEPKQKNRQLGHGHHFHHTSLLPPTSLSVRVVRHVVHTYMYTDQRLQPVATPSRRADPCYTPPPQKQHPYQT
jgi:hypothetical protein